MPTLAAIRSRLLDDLGLGYTRTSLDARAAGSVTDAGLLRNTNFASNHFLDWGIHCPDTATAADNFRFAGALTNTTGLLAQTGASYSDIVTTSETWNLIPPGIRPDEDIDPAINRALEYVAFHTVEVLSLAADANMRETAVASWGTAVTATTAKQTTASRVFPGMGIRSLAITCTSANGYLPTANIPVTPGEQVFVATISRVNSGTSATVQLRDVTNSANFGTNPVHSESTWQYMQQIETVPTGCRNINVRLQGVGASDVIDWQCLWVIRQSILRYNLPSYLDERYKVDAVSFLGFTKATDGTTGAVMQALSVDTQEIEKDQYAADFPMPEANPTYIQFHAPFWGGLWQRRFGPRFGSGIGTGYFPLVLQMRLPYSERGTLSLEADITTCPLHLIVPASEVQLLQTCPAAVRHASKSLQQVRAEFMQASNVRAGKAPARRMTWSQARTAN